MLILAYADWCNPCKRAKPVWTSFKAKYGSILDMREVNADRDKSIIEQLKVEGFPTIILLNNGKRILFNGKIDIPSLESFIKSNLNNILYYVYADWCGFCRKFKGTFTEFKKKYNPVLNIQELNADKDKAMIEKLQVPGFPSIILMKEGKRIEFTGERNMQELEKFIKLNNPHIEENLANYRAL